jgi:hypothetical protein
MTTYWRHLAISHNWPNAQAVLAHIKANMAVGERLQAFEDVTSAHS